MPAARTFTELKFWQRARQWSKTIFQLTERERFARDRRLTEFGDLFQEGTEIRKMTVAFIGAMIMPGSGVKHLRKEKNWTDEVWERYERITGKPRPPLFRRPTEDE